MEHLHGDITLLLSAPPPPTVSPCPKSPSLGAEGVGGRGIGSERGWDTAMAEEPVNKPLAVESEGLEASRLPALPGKIGPEFPLGTCDFFSLRLREADHRLGQVEAELAEERLRARAAEGLRRSTELIGAALITLLTQQVSCGSRGEGILLHCPQHSKHQLEHPDCTMLPLAESPLQMASLQQQLQDAHRENSEARSLQDSALKDVRSDQVLLAEEMKKLRAELTEVSLLAFFASTMPAEGL
jgi:hypothetical protein